MTEALVAGALAGYGIAVPVGAIEVLIVTPRQRLLDNLRTWDVYRAGGGPAPAWWWCGGL